MTELMKALEEAKLIRYILISEDNAYGIYACKKYEHFATLALAENKKKDERIAHLESIIKRAKEKLKNNISVDGIANTINILSEADK